MGTCHTHDLWVLTQLESFANHILGAEITTWAQYHMAHWQALLVLIATSAYISIAFSHVIDLISTKQTESGNDLVLLFGDGFG